MKKTLIAKALIVLCSLILFVGGVSVTFIAGHNNEYDVAFIGSVIILEAVIGGYYLVKTI